MTRVKRGKITCRTRKKRMQSVKGFRGAWSTLSRPAIQGSLRALNYSYKHRRKNVKTFRRLSIIRFNALIRNSGLPFTYNQLIALINLYNCKLNRNVLSQLGVRDSNTFTKLMKFYYH